MSVADVRLALDSDNDRIIGLAERCPQEGMITFFIDRTPRFNTVHRLLDPEAWHFIACKDDAVIGLVGAVHFRARVLGRDIKAAYMLDFRVDKEYRSGITTFRLVKSAVDHLYHSDTDMVLVNFLKDNRHPLVFTSGRGGLPKSYYLGDNTVFNIIPLRRMKLNRRYTIESPTEDDIPSLVELYNKYAAGFRIAPGITEESFRKYITTVRGLSLDNFFMAREGGTIRAVTALWDEHEYKTYQVLKINTSIRIVSKVLAFLSCFMRVPQPIRLNEPLRHQSLVLYAHDGNPEALDTLFRHINNVSLGSGYTLIMLYVQDNDPLMRLMKSHTCVRVKSEMHLFAKDASLPGLLEKDPSAVMLDLAMVL